ncbi:MAG: riboflavin synthase [Actinomycetaceae bacterium]|nr:riboflavin synthase [Actinomycetaceae bacterium]
MFTGLIEEIGTITELTPTGGSIKMAVSCCFAGTCVIGESIATNGVCLSVTDCDDTQFWVDMMPETLKMSSLGTKQPGDRVNLERSLKLGDRLGGHLVQGHVDATGIISHVKQGETWTDVTVDIPQSISGYIAMKGSVCIDGVSLTVTGVGDNWFSVSLIPETLRATTLGQLHLHQCVNIETDMLARYVQRLIQQGVTQ